VVTAKIGGNAMVWHLRAGFAILALVLFRILWGFTGSRHARFANFLRGPTAVIDYAKCFVTGSHSVVVGHNPLGGWSVVALLAVLLVQVTTGLFANDDIATDGPLVKLISKDLSDTITGYHHRNLWLVGGLVALHLSAVFFHLLALKDNLIRPMVNGVKQLPLRWAGNGAGPVSHARALVLFALCVLAVGWLVAR
jgi:cytochrome b